MTRRLAEVARKVGVSEATVSRVLNGKPGVAESTRQAVLTALDVLGYERPSKLRGERARLVGLVLPELQNPIFPAIAEVMGVGLAQRGFTPVLCTQTAGGVSEADYVELLLQQQVSGVVFAGGLYAQEDAPHGHYARLRRARAAHGPGQRVDRGPRLSPGVVRRRRRGRPGDGASPLARAHLDRHPGRPDRPHPVAAQDRRGPGRGAEGGDRARSGPDRPRLVLDRGRAGRRRPPDRCRRDRDRVRQRPHGARCDPRAPSGPAGACPAISRSSGSTIRS